MASHTRMYSEYLEETPFMVCLLSLIPTFVPMPAITFHNQDIDFKLNHKLRHKKWLKAIITANKHTLGYVNYIFMTDDGLLEVNKQYLNHDYYTDIITFDTSERDTEISADIYISIERIVENAKEFSVAFEAELRRVLAHGLLHLVGYKDKTAEQKAIMRRKEDEALLLFEEFYTIENKNP